MSCNHDRTQTTVVDVALAELAGAGCVWRGVRGQQRVNSAWRVRLAFDFRKKPMTASDVVCWPKVKVG